MSNTKEDFETIYSKSAKSAKQYFVDQSRGKFSPQFDLYGIYTLSSNRATYGGNDYNGNDKGVAKMVGEACQLAEKELWFTPVWAKHKPMASCLMLFGLANGS